MLEIKCDTKSERKLPKDIRQIGAVPGKQKIYVEDYVVTYLSQLAHPTNSIARGAVLLGEWVKCGEEQILFISGAVEADNLSFDMNQIQFTNEIWTALHEKIGQYFDDVKVVGWFLSRLGYSSDLTDTMIRVHNKYFKEEGSVLFLMDALEQEDAFYIHGAGHMRKQPGYYIYYEHNTQMQNYLVENHAFRHPTPAQQKIEYKDEQVLKNYREIMEGRKAKKEEQKVVNLLYVTSALLTIVFLALGITIFDNYDKIKNMQSSLDHLANVDETTENVEDWKSELAVNEEDSEVVATTALEATKDVTTENTTQESTTQAATTQAMTTQAATTQQKKQETKSQSSSKQTDNKGTSAAVPDNNKVVEASNNKVLGYYTVKQGDTLITISQKIYHSAVYVSLLKQANELGDEDMIYVGQQLMLPSVN